MPTDDLRDVYGRQLYPNRRTVPVFTGSGGYVNNTYVLDHTGSDKGTYDLVSSVPDAELGGGSSGGGGGYGYGGYGYGGYGGGFDYTNPKVINQIKDEFEFWFGSGNVPAGMVDTALTEGWTSEMIRKWSLNNGAHGLHAEEARYAVVEGIGLVWGSKDATDWVRQHPEYINMLAGQSQFNPDSVADHFRQMPSYDVMRAPESQAAIQLWTEMTGIPLTWTAQNKLRDIMRVHGGWTAAAQAEWGAWLPTTQSAIGGNYGASKREGMREFFETFFGRQPTDEELDSKGELWNLNTEALMEWAREQPEYAERFAGKPEWMDEGDFLSAKPAFDLIFRRMYGERVAQPGELGVPGTGETPGPAEMPPELLTYYLENDTSAEEIWQQFSWVEEAAYNREIYNPQLEEAFGATFTDDDWYAIASGAEGSGVLKAKLVEAQNRTSFREVFRNYTGRDPDVEDYDALTSSYVSPQEYAHRMAAKESAAAKLPEVNELMQRIYGRGTSLGELENMAMGGEGSGSLEAKISQAMRLDQYRWIHKQKYGTEPTPRDYANYAGYASPAELEWELDTAEKLAEFGPDIKELWGKFYPDEKITDDDLQKMLGDMKGGGALRYKLNKAKEREKEVEQGRELAYSGQRAFTPFQISQGGGIQVAMPGLADLN